MRLRPAAFEYSRPLESERIRQIEAADRQNHKRAQDIEVKPGRLILTSPDGTRYAVNVANGGALSASAV